MKAEGRFLHINFSIRLAALAVSVILVAGCGDESEEPSATVTVTGSDSGGGSSDGGSDGGGTGDGSGGGGSGGGDTGGGITLDISGSIPSQILEGTSFSFTPTIINPDDVALTFSATNLPSWASIDSATGEVSGMPGAADVGLYSGISLTVSGGGTSATTPDYSIEVVAVASGSASLSWLPPTEREDGSPLNNELAGYKIYYGQSETDLDQSITIDDPGVTAYVIEDLTPATWYFTATAFDTDGFESGSSNVASKTIL